MNEEVVNTVMENTSLRQQQHSNFIEEHFMKPERPVKNPRRQNRLVLFPTSNMVNRQNEPCYLENSTWHSSLDCTRKVNMESSSSMGSTFASVYDKPCGSQIRKQSRFCSDADLANMSPRIA
ncbi:hypothetical protein PoB_005327800 [Plakobranchus ocellatus]|uniref:Uncharacterized protein n=1 Tax=Plakobranchus ocellatus TaxID=259542 RepID=A0AAV4C6Y9_9GAST|nr:hypothetical protein PoB_005327800 [Plakobranchus ocellatus]